MKKAILISIFPILLVFCWGSISFARPYMSGNVGVGFVEDYTIDDEEFNERGEFSFDPGFTLSGAIGYEFLYGFRAELELGYQMSDMDKLRVSGDFGSEAFSINGDISALTVMANIFYDFIPNQILSPFLGVGVGFANLDFDFSEADISDDDTVFAYQLMAGIAYALNNNLRFDIQYRFFGTEKPSYNFGFPISVDEYQTHNILFGMRYAF